MRFALQLPTDKVQFGAEFGSAEGVMEMARSAESLGYDAVFVTEHPIPENSWFESGGHHALDPFVALAFAAAATSRLRLLTNLCVVPYRNPFLTAKAVATLDSMSGGRLILGAGAGYLEAEFKALEVDYSQRNELFDQALVTMKQAWTGESVDVGGVGHHALPRPAQSPHPPIWIGGNSRRAIRRCVDLADGWMPIPNPSKFAARRHTPALESHDDLRARLDYLREYAAEQGRPGPRDILFMPLGGGMYGSPEFDAQAQIEEIGRLGELGVTELGVGFPTETRSDFLRFAEDYAAQVVDRAG